MFMGCRRAADIQRHAIATALSIKEKPIFEEGTHRYAAK
jgi:hypothetical protein